MTMKSMEQSSNGAVAGQEWFPTVPRCAVVAPEADSVLAAVFFSFLVALKVAALFYNPVNLFFDGCPPGEGYAVFGCYCPAL